jgi:hypothetical protein
MISALARRILTSAEFETGTFVSFAVAVLLNTFGVIGDPFVWGAHLFAFSDAETGELTAAIDGRPQSLPKIRDSV